MDVKVDIKAATERVKSFLSTHGGEAKHSEVLELVAKMCGFDSYRAMKSVESKARRTTVASSKYEARTLEQENNVVFRATTLDWQVGHDPHIGFDIVPMEQRQQYDVIVEDFGCQYRFLVKPTGVGLDNFDGRAVLDMMVEINEGVPCVHMTNDPADAMLLSVFATEQGLLVRPDDGEWMKADSYRVPAVLQGLAKEACGHELHESYVAVLDTAEKYRDDVAPVAAVPATDTAPEAPEASVPAVPCVVMSATTTQCAPLWGREEILLPSDKRYVGAFVEVTFPNLEKTSVGPQPMQVQIIDSQGVVGDEDFLVVMSSFEGDKDILVMHAFAIRIGALVGHFISAGHTLQGLKPLIEAMAKRSDAELASLCGEVLFEASPVDGYRKAELFLNLN